MLQIEIKLVLFGLELLTFRRAIGHDLTGHEAIAGFDFEVLGLGERQFER